MVLTRASLKAALMSATLCRMLTIDKRKVIFPILFHMGKGHFYVVAFNMNNGVKGILGQILIWRSLSPPSNGNACRCNGS